MAITDQLSARRRRALSTGLPLANNRPGTNLPALTLPPEASDLASAILLVNAWRAWMIDIGQGVDD
jgi:hypothetical protein